MDTSPDGIAENVISVLTPLIISGATEFAKRAGTGLFDAAKDLFSVLKAKLSEDQEAAEHLARFETAPAPQREDFKRFLEAWLANDPELRELLACSLAPLAPSLHIIQKVGIADRVTGITANEMTEGRLKVEIEVQEAKDVTGAHVTRIGR